MTNEEAKKVDASEWMTQSILVNVVGREQLTSTYI